LQQFEYDIGTTAFDDAGVRDLDNASLAGYAMRILTTPDCGKTPCTLAVGVKENTAKATRPENQWSWASSGSYSSTPEMKLRPVFVKGSLRVEVVRDGSCKSVRLDGNLGVMASPNSCAIAAAGLQKCAAGTFMYAAQFG
jgi:hypothetical protein